MPQPDPCRTHDMRPMPSLQANVCRRCGYYVPIEDEEGTFQMSPNWWIAPVIVGGLILIAIAAALALN